MADMYVKPRTSVPRGSPLMAPVFFLCVIGAIIAFFIGGWAEDFFNRARKLFGKKAE